MEDVVEEQEELTPEDIMAEARELHYEQIVAMNKLVGEATVKADNAKTKAKIAKEELEDLQTQLSLLISEGPKLPDPQKQLPFDEAWRELPIEEVLTITEKQLEKLHEAGINTVIEFEYERGGNRFAGVKGIGEKTVDKWEEEIIEWLGKNAREQEGEGDVHQ